MSSGYDYDVFLSFRGRDTRSGITNFLYTRLLGARIHTFKDDEELRVGEEFGPELLTAISQSKIAIPIFSKGYASSKWCLNELVQMVECSKTRRQKIMPIFYDVTPAEVRHQIGSYEEAFLSHKEKFGANVDKWKAALNHVANLNGWVNSKENRGEGELVEEIVEKVIDELKTAYLLVTDCLVGVENHNSWNPWYGGVGKTTLAKIIYNRLLHHFEACCFLSNIRETSELKGIEGLQNKLIYDVLKKKWANISNVEEGIKIIKERLCGKKVLLLLDDVDQMTHWDALIGKPARFSLGSRIIITSRNRDIIDVPEVCYPYELMSLDFNQSLQLFCKHAFWRDYPLDEYVAFSTEVVKSTGGLPLALEAIGKLLRHRSKDVWDVILKKLKQVPLSEVKRKLKISYDTLDDCQKHIFLEIACLFAGFDQRIVLHSWKDSNLFPKECLEVLQQISLIKISEDNKLWMHDQLRGLGTDIVRRECDKERKKKKDSVGEPSGRFGRVDGNEGNKKNSSSLSKI
ncbi:disease resistance protein RUN1 [Eucalyptus grandis]|uniref:disease resistance protein RUN1 n=1 Tax=Eucalyptus grandis TaxID=71139 RepID=UPI00192EF330|nr:disease resistance protein RUN1 [Eucalyptus grandis]